MSVPDLRAKNPYPTQQFPRTAKTFDWLLYVSGRVEELLWQSKYLLFGLGFLAFLVYELAHFAKFLLKNWVGH